MKFNYYKSAAPYAFIVTHPAGHAVGSMFNDGHDAFKFQRSRWDGKKQVFDTLHSHSLSDLDRQIEELLK